ncbi:MAG: prolipoprotein diacylglyceryl transferase [Candidatus Roizmanbacteria bacterium]|nr:prolipoprotein diacylglyceryl transferase [Candidatus Roizmanbacteria bacterium]
MNQLSKFFPKAFPLLNTFGYGILLAISFVVALFFLWRELHRSSFKEERFFDMLFLSLCAGLALGRLTFFFTENPAFALNPLNFFIVYIFPGFSLFGTVFGFFLCMYLLTKKYKENFIEVLHLFFVPFFTFFTVYSFLNMLHNPFWQEFVRLLLFVTVLFFLPYIRQKEQLNKLTHRCTITLLLVLFSAIEFTTNLSVGPGLRIIFSSVEVWFFLFVCVLSSIKLVFCFMKKKQ